MSYRSTVAFAYSICLVKSEGSWDVKSSIEHDWLVSLVREILEECLESLVS